MTTPGTNSNDDAKRSLAQALRSQIGERVNYQHQLLAVAAAIAGAAATFGTKDLRGHPEVLALFALLFVGFALALLRHEQEITLITEHLVDPKAFGEIAEVEQAWESYRLGILQRSGVVGIMTSAALTVGIYGVPVLAAIAFGWAALSDSPTALAWTALGVAMGLSLLFVVGVAEVLRRYQRIASGNRAPQAS